MAELFGSFRWRGNTLYLDYYNERGERQRPKFARMRKATERKNLELAARKHLNRLENEVARKQEDLLKENQLFDNTDYPTYRQIALFYFEKKVCQKDYIKKNPSMKAAEWHNITKSVEFFKNTPCDKIERSDIKQFRMALREMKNRKGDPWSNAFVNRIVSAVGQIYSFAINQEMWTYATASKEEKERYGNINLCDNLDNPRHGLMRLMEEPENAIIPTYDQFVKLIGLLKPQVKRMSVIGIHTGLRPRNIIQLRQSEVDFDRNLIVIRDHKGKPQLEISMHSDIVTVLCDQIEENKKSGIISEYFFPKWDGTPVKSIRDHWNKKCDEAGIAGFQFKKLRNTYTTWRVEEGVELGLLQHILGHTSVSTTARFYNKAKRASEKVVPTQRSVLNL